MLTMLLRRTDALLTALLYPRRTICPGCRRLSRGGVLCPRCTQELADCRVQGLLCPVCGHPGRGKCTFCGGVLPGRMRSVWHHRGLARRMVHQLKYRGVSVCAELLSADMAELAASLDLPEHTLVTWVAMPRSRLKLRGVDHSRLLAQGVAQRLGLECRCLLTRRDEGRTQRGLTREERLRNLNGAFACPEQLDRPVLLIDDVLTTSATAQLCSLTLLQSGAPSVTVVTATQA